MSVTITMGHFFHVHADLSHDRDIDVDPFVQRPVKVPSFLKKLADVTASNIGSQLLSQVRAIEPLTDSLETLCDSRVTTHDAGMIIVHQYMGLGSGNAQSSMGKPCACVCVQYFKQQAI